MTESSFTSSSNIIQQNGFQSKPIEATAPAEAPVKTIDIDMTPQTESTPVVEDSPVSGASNPQVVGANFDSDKISSDAIKIVSKNAEGFDSDALSIGANYDMFRYCQKDRHFGTNENGDGTSITGESATVDAFKGQFRRNKADRTSFEQSVSRFASLDNVNFRYMSHPILGDMRVAIDPETGKDCGLPEPLLA